MQRLEIENLQAHEVLGALNDMAFETILTYFRIIFLLYNL
jgi:hypothetical protein